MEIERYLIEETDTSLKFVFPNRKRFGLRVMTLGQTCGAFLIAYVFYSGLEISDPYFWRNVIPFLVFLSFAIYCLIEFLWHSIGKESIEITPAGIILSHKILWLRFSKFLPLKGMSSFCVPTKSYNWMRETRGFSYFNFRYGPVEINCGKSIWWGKNIYRFGSVMNKSQAKFLTAHIHHKFPQYKS